MKIFSFFLCGVLATASAARAQGAPQSGYDLLIGASKALVEGESGYPTPFPVPDKPLSPQENLRRQRAAVVRNAAALQLLREALKLGVEPPATPPKSGFSPHAARFRTLARLLRQESDVRAADGDLVNALNSRLDAVELGISSVRGGALLAGLVGDAIENLALGNLGPRSGLDSLVAHLDAPQCRAAALRLAQLDAKRTSLAAIYENEKQISLGLLHEYADRPDWATYIQSQKGRDGLGLNLTSGEAAQLAALSFAELAARIAAQFDLAVAQSLKPYPQMQPALPEAPDKLTLILSPENIRLARFSHERTVTVSRLLQGALELRALKLESGAYPATFNAPLDPYSGAPLLYRRNGDSYLLYSFGPDGRDDGGRRAIAKRTFFDLDSGQWRTQKMSSVIGLDNEGDILAPVF